MASGFKSLNLATKTSKALSIANATALTEKMELVFSDIKDPRVERTRVHLLTDILIIGILSVIAADFSRDVERRDWFANDIREPISHKKDQKICWYCRYRCE